MPDYTELILADLKGAGWDAEVAEPFPGRFVAMGRKAGHTCLSESDSDLGALVGLLKSVREVEACRMFAEGMVVKLREPLEDVREGYYVIVAVDGDGLKLCALGEDLESGDLVCSGGVCSLAMRDAEKLLRTGIMLSRIDP